MGYTTVKGRNKSLQMLLRMWRKKNIPSLLVGLQAGTTTLEMSVAAPQKVGHRT